MILKLTIHFDLSGGDFMAFDTTLTMETRGEAMAFLLGMKLAQEKIVIEAYQDPDETITVLLSIRSKRLGDYLAHIKSFSRELALARLEDREEGSPLRDTSDGGGEITFTL